MGYPNLKALIENHPYNILSFADHAGVTVELLEAALDGKKELHAGELYGIARLTGVPCSALDCQKLIMLDMKRWRHGIMAAEIDDLYFRLVSMAKEGNRTAEKHLEQADEAHECFLGAVYANKLSYCHYLGVKERLQDYISFARPKREKRGIASGKGGVA